jgi:hypothetical protein
MAELGLVLAGLSVEAMKEVQDHFRRKTGVMELQACPYFWCPEMQANPDLLPGYSWYWPIDGVHTPEVKMSEHGYHVAVVMV